MQFKMASFHMFNVSSWQKAQTTNNLSNRGCVALINKI